LKTRIEIHLYNGKVYTREYQGHFDASTRLYIKEGKTLLKFLREDKYSILENGDITVVYRYYKGDNMSENIQEILETWVSQTALNYLTGVFEIKASERSEHLSLVVTSIECSGFPKGTVLEAIYFDTTEGVVRGFKNSKTINIIKGMLKEGKIIIYDYELKD